MPEGKAKSEQAPIRRPPFSAEGHCTRAHPGAFLFGPCTARFSFGKTKEKWGVHPGWTSPLREQRPRGRRPAARPREHASPILVGGVAVLALMVVVLMMGYVKLTQASHDLTAKQSQLQQVQEERVALGVAYEKAFDQAAVKAAAQAAGMTKPTSDQIEYIELGGADMAEICRPESTGPLAQAWTWLKDGIGAVVEYFR